MDSRSGAAGIRLSVRRDRSSNCHRPVLCPLRCWEYIPASAIKLLALASDENALQFWASAPDHNPLNSPSVVNGLAKERDLSTFKLTQYYSVASLGSGVLPNGNHVPGADMRFRIDSTPGGTGVTFLNDDLLDIVTPGAPLDANLDGVPDNPLPFNQPKPLGHGQTISYNLHYENTGSAEAKNIQVKVTARGAVRLAGNQTTATFNLGNVAPGVVSVLQFTGSIDTALNGSAAEMDAVISDDQHGDFDYIWMLHPVDSVAPTDVQITRPATYVRSGRTLITGLAADSPVCRSSHLQITAQPSNAVTNITCTDPTPTMVSGPANGMRGMWPASLNSNCAHARLTATDW